MEFIVKGHRNENHLIELTFSREACKLSFGDIIKKRDGKNYQNSRDISLKSFVKNICDGKNHFIIQGGLYACYKYFTLGLLCHSEEDRIYSLDKPCDKNYLIFYLQKRDAQISGTPLHVLFDENVVDQYFEPYIVRDKIRVQKGTFYFFYSSSYLVFKVVNGENVNVVDFTETSSFFDFGDLSDAVISKPTSQLAAAAVDFPSSSSSALDQQVDISQVDISQLLQTIENLQTIVLNQNLDLLSKFTIGNVYCNAYKKFFGPDKISEMCDLKSNHLLSENKLESTSMTDGYVIKASNNNIDGAVIKSQIFNHLFVTIDKNEIARREYYESNNVDLLAYLQSTNRDVRMWCEQDVCLFTSYVNYLLAKFEGVIGEQMQYDSGVHDYLNKLLKCVKTDQVNFGSRGLINQLFEIFIRFVQRMNNSKNGMEFM